MAINSIISSIEGYEKIQENSKIQLKSLNDELSSINTTVDDSELLLKRMDELKDQIALKNNTIKESEENHKKSVENLEKTTLKNKKKYNELLKKDMIAEAEYNGYIDEKKKLEVSLSMQSISDKRKEYIKNKLSEIEKKISGYDEHKEKLSSLKKEFELGKEKFNKISTKKIGEISDENEFETVKEEPVEKIEKQPDVKVAENPRKSERNLKNDAIDIKFVEVEEDGSEIIEEEPAEKPVKQPDVKLAEKIVKKIDVKPTEKPTKQPDVKVDEKSEDGKQVEPEALPFHMYVNFLEKAPIEKGLFKGKKNIAAITDVISKSSPKEFETLVKLFCDKNFVMKNEVPYRYLESMHKYIAANAFNNTKEGKFTINKMEFLKKDNEHTYNILQNSLGLIYDSASTRKSFFGIFKNNKTNMEEIKLLDGMTQSIVKARNAKDTNKVSSITEELKKAVNFTPIQQTSTKEPKEKEIETK